MDNVSYVHVVDRDVGRRAQMAHQLFNRRCHAEIYENVDELVVKAPKRGAVLMHDDEDTADWKANLDAIYGRTGYLPVALYSTRPSPRQIVRAVSSGVLDYLEWPCPAGDLAQAVVRLTIEGERKARFYRQRYEARRAVEDLTNRERDVLRCLVDGSSNKQIAALLGISPRTVEIHRGNMMRRLGAESVADVVRIGLRADIAD